MPSDLSLMFERIVCHLFMNALTISKKKGDFYMKRLVSLAILMMFSTILLAACVDSGTPAEPEQNPDIIPDANEDTTPPTEVDPFPSGDVSYIRVMYDRIDWRDNLDGSVIIRSVEELDEYYEELNAANMNELDDDLVWRLTGGHYNDAFFAENFLVLVTVSEPSGSNRHDLTSLTENNNKLSINISRFVPEIGTADMAGWLITIELSGNYSISETDVVFTDVPMNG